MTNIFTTHKQSLGQGYIFAPVCHSVHRGEYPGRYPDQVPPRTRCPKDQVYTQYQVPPGTRYTSPEDQVHPQDQIPPWGQVPPRNHVYLLGTGIHPSGTRYIPGTRYPFPTRWEQCMLGDTGNKRAVRTLLECILVVTEFSKNILWNL